MALLLRAGADPLLTDSIGRLPLHYAVEVDLEHQVRGLLPTQRAGPALSLCIHISQRS